MQPTEQHALDNLIFKSLSTSHSHLSLCHGKAKRFHPDVSTLADVEIEGDVASTAPSQEGMNDLLQLVNQGETVGLLVRLDPVIVDGFEQVIVVPCLEMVCSELNEFESKGYCNHDVEIRQLGYDDVPSIIPLVDLTRPGPFSKRTIDMGSYYGIFDTNDDLVAMSGERMKLPGYTEISAVCTHPNHAGKKYASTLIIHLLRSIFERGEQALLHVRVDNDRAIQLYQRLGFVTRCTVNYIILKKL